MKEAPPPFQVVKDVCLQGGRFGPMMVRVGPTQKKKETNFVKRNNEETQRLFMDFTHVHQTQSEDPSVSFRSSRQRPRSGRTRSTPSRENEGRANTPCRVP